MTLATTSPNLTYFRVTPNWRRAFLTAVGEQVLVAFCAILNVVFQHVLLPQQGVLAVMAIESLTGHINSPPDWPKWEIEPFSGRF